MPCCLWRMARQPGPGAACDRKIRLVVLTMVAAVATFLIHVHLDTNMHASQLAIVGCWMVYDDAPAVVSEVAAEVLGGRGHGIAKADRRVGVRKRRLRRGLREQRLATKQRRRAAHPAASDAAKSVGSQLRMALLFGRL